MTSLEDCHLLDDPKYRQYLNHVERVLKSFESSSEWADLISALGKLNKVLSAKFNTIPKKITIGKRLAQCMHPVLPGGVHLKALDVYDTIFKIVGTKRLQSDLYIYTIGIFPLFATASMQVRPKLLNLYETHFLPLNGGLISCLDGMLLGLLPGLEEGTEQFHHTDTVLDKVCNKVTALEFYSALWRCILSSPQVRLAALQLVYRRFDRKKSTDDQLFIIGYNVDVMVQALCEALQDESVLAQRASLDVLVLCCPLSNIPVSKKDACNLLFAALHCILRRDMSLNRRLYSWLLGYDLAKRHHSVGSYEHDEDTYFDTFSKHLLTKAFSQILEKQSARLEKFDIDMRIRLSDELYPCRLLVTILDKQEIGPLIIEDLMLYVFRLLKAAVNFLKMKLNRLNKRIDEQDGNTFKSLILPEISKSFNLLLNAFEPSYLWFFCLEQLKQAIEIASSDRSKNEEGKPAISEMFEYICLHLNLINMNAHGELQTVHLPNLLYGVIKTLNKSIEVLNLEELQQGLETCEKLLEYCQPSQQANSQSVIVLSKAMPSHQDDTVPSLRSLDSLDRRKENAKKPTNHGVQQCTRLFYTFYCRLIETKLNANRDVVDRFVTKLENPKVRGFVLNLQAQEKIFKPPLINNDNDSDGGNSISGKITVLVLPPLNLKQITTLFNSTCFIPLTTKILWNVLDDPSISAQHLTAVRLLFRLHSMCPDGRCEEMILEELVHWKKEIRTNALSKFCRMWHYARHLLSNKVTLQGFKFRNFTRCLFATIDALSFAPIPSHLVGLNFELDDCGRGVDVAIASSWLRHCLEERDIIRLLDPLLSVILHHSTHCSPVSSFPKDTPMRFPAASDGVIEANAARYASSEEIMIPGVGPKAKSLADFRRTILEDMDKERGNYNDLVSSLTMLSTPSKEDLLVGQANEFVTSIIKSSVSLLKVNDSGDDMLDHYVPEAPDSLELFAKNPVEENLFELALNINLDASHETQNRYQRNSGLRPNTHMLVYQEELDAARCTYSLRSIRNLLLAQPMLFTYTCIISSLNSAAIHQSLGVRLQDALTRHLRSIAGHSYYEDLPSRPQNFMVFDILLVICLRSMRSWRAPGSSIPSGPLHDLRCIALSLLESLLAQLSKLLYEPLSLSGLSSSSTSSSSVMTSRQLGLFVRSILNKYGLSEMVTASLQSTVEALQTLNSQGEDDEEEMVDIDNFLSDNADRASLMSLQGSQLAVWWSGGSMTKIKSFQQHLIGVVRQVIVIEYRLGTGDFCGGESIDGKDAKLPKELNTDFLIRIQPLVFTSLLRILRLRSSCDLHSAWLDLMTFTLPYITDALPEVALSLTSQLCRNLEHTTTLYLSYKETSSAMSRIPADYVVTLLKSMQALTNGTLFLSNAPPAIRSLFAAGSPEAKSMTASSGNSSPPSTLAALGNFFSSITGGNANKPQRNNEHPISESWIRARKATLRNLPKILICLATVWDKVVADKPLQVQRRKGRKIVMEVNPCCAFGEREAVSQSIFQIINPIVLQYGENLICALAVAWEKRGRNELRQPDISFSRQHLSAQQNLLLNLVSYTSSLHCDVTLNLVRNVIIQPPSLPSTMTSKQRKIQYEERLLHFVYLFIQLQSGKSLRESWPSLFLLLRDCAAMPPSVNLSNTTFNLESSGTNQQIADKGKLTPRCYFLLLLMVAEFVKKVPSFEDKKDQKDLQDICVKCVEACNAIVDRSLEHGGWLGRRGPIVLATPVTNSDNDSSVKLTASTEDQLTKRVLSALPVPLRRDESTMSSVRSSQIREQSLIKNSFYQSSVQALNILSQVIANLLDVVYGSEEKEKTVPVLSSVMINAVPFLRTRSYKNAASFRAATSLLSGLSSYQHTRKSWKKEVYDIFLSPDFFRMPYDCVSEWSNIIDHLMTHDAITFKDFMARLGTTRSTTSGASLNIFSNRDLELEQRAMLLKRLSFIIFSSATNQYQRFLPEIQERLTESLKLLQVPSVQEQVFLCFRVLLLRVSPSNLTSLWPTIITELVNTMGQFEEDLMDVPVGAPNTNTSRSSSRTRSISSTRSNGYSSVAGNTPMQDKWLAFYLSSCKLLDLALSLQARHLPHFKMFRWSFVGETNDVSNGEMASPRRRSRNRKRNSKNLRVELEKEKCTLSVAEKEDKYVFVPHCVRIQTLLATKNPRGAHSKLTVVPLHPLLEMKQIESVEQLQEFFNTIVSPTTMMKQHQHTEADPAASDTARGSQKVASPMERCLWRDFLNEMV